MLEERRLRVYYLSQKYLLEFLRVKLAPDNWLQWPVVEGPPEGSIVHHVFHDPTRMAFGVVVSHESFPEIADSAEIPRSRDSLSIMMRAIKIVDNTGILS